jgi:ABC-2 type transport system ATP-binding protein
MESIIEIKNLTKKYGDAIALNDVTFSVGEGEAFGLLGPNGAGKTTMVRVLLNILNPTSGIVKVFDTDVTSSEYDEKRKRIGFMLESIGLSYNLTGYENMEFFDRIYNEKATEGERKERIKDLLTFVGLWEERDKRVGNYSHGMGRRLALARALICDPALIFLDEPTLGLDPEARLLIREMLLALKKEKKTIFLTSHDLEEVQKICSHIAILKGGNLIADDSYENLSKTLSKKRVIIKVKKIEGWLNELKTAVKNIEVADDNTLYVDYDGDTDFLFNLLAKNGASVTEMKREETGLEEIYLEMIKSEPQRRNELVGMARKGVKR